MPCPRPCAVYCVTSGAIGVHKEHGVADFKSSVLEKMRAQLTPRRREVLHLVAVGKSSKEIAAILKISAKTVDSHRIGLMHELGTRNVAELVRYSVSEGVIREQILG